MLVVESWKRKFGPIAGDDATTFVGLIVRLTYGQWSWSGGCGHCPIV
jgi:hypothetical protein